MEAASSLGERRVRTPLGRGSDFANAILGASRIVRASA